MRCGVKQHPMNYLIYLIHSVKMIPHKNQKLNVIVGTTAYNYYVAQQAV